MRGRNLGKLIITELLALARRAGAYKVLLDCKESNVPFYEKCGLVRKEVTMAHYFAA
jgi:glucosamine-phosphate N-acetyltransferase